MLFWLFGLPILLLLAGMLWQAAWPILIVVLVIGVVLKIVF
jgi:hypothetical protein